MANRLNVSADPQSAMEGRWVWLMVSIKASRSQRNEDHINPDRDQLSGKDDVCVMRYVHMVLNEEKWTYRRKGKIIIFANFQPWNKTLQIDQGHSVGELETPEKACLGDQ
jgi:hypothetical protein